VEGLTLIFVDFPDFLGALLLELLKQLGKQFPLGSHDHVAQVHSVDVFNCLGQLSIWVVVLNVSLGDDLVPEQRPVLHQLHLAGIE